MPVLNSSEVESNQFLIVERFALTIRAPGVYNPTFKGGAPRGPPSLREVTTQPERAACRKIP
jgi:hypothetical protein